ncbi:MAG: NAD kinase [Flavobacteriales bacterium]|nr:NAD kinase [Flavobacteriales bacterium]
MCDEKYVPHIQTMFDTFSEAGVQIFVYSAFREFLKNKITLPTVGIFQRSSELIGMVDAFVSIGGDGTILDSATLVKESLIPIIGINTGRVGFLSTLQMEDLSNYMPSILAGDFEVDSRDMIQLETKQRLFGDTNYALNEMVVHKKDTSSMISIHTYLNDEYMCTYWADGLIISTPTGSTAYSLSCGGPIVLPDANTIIINPIAPHNLNSRPMVISNNKTIKLKIEGRSKYFLASLDSRQETIDSNVEMLIRKCDFPMNFVRLKEHSFLRTINKKLHWGYDQRN